MEIILSNSIYSHFIGIMVCLISLVCLIISDCSDSVPLLMSSDERLTKLRSSSQRSMTNSTSLLPSAIGSLSKKYSDGGTIDETDEMRRALRPTLSSAAGGSAFSRMMFARVASGNSNDCDEKDDWGPSPHVSAEDLIHPDVIDNEVRKVI